MKYPTLKTLGSAVALSSVMIASGAHAKAEAKAEAKDLGMAITGGNVGLNFRYRYENVDQNGIDREANASTLKSRLTWSSLPYRGFSAKIEVDNVTVIGDERFRTPTNGETEFPIVADPDGTDVNQVFVKYKSEDFSTTAGRQRIVHGSQRFIGGVAWRQNEQTYDAVRLEVPSLGPVKLDYSYIADVNRIFGPEDSAVQPKRWQSDSHALLASFSPADGHTVTLFSYLLDFENALVNSSSTYGAEYNGKLGPVTLKAALASQSDYTDNPRDYEAEYYFVEAAVKVQKVTLGVGYEVLGSDDGAFAFRTPLATLHKFQGWADKFLVTPNAGIEDAYVKAAGKIGPVGVAAFYHDFSAEEGNADYGTEFNLVANYKVNKHISTQLKYADYSADELATDTSKLWLTLNFKF